MYLYDSVLDKYKGIHMKGMQAYMEASTTIYYTIGTSQVKVISKEVEFHSSYLNCPFTWYNRWWNDHRTR